MDQYVSGLQKTEAREAARLELARRLVAKWLLLSSDDATVAGALVIVSAATPEEARAFFDQHVAAEGRTVDVYELSPLP